MQKYEREATENPKLWLAVYTELQIASSGLSFVEVRQEIYPGKSLEEIWNQLWVDPPEPDEYLRTHRAELKAEINSLYGR